MYDFPKKSTLEKHIKYKPNRLSSSSTFDWNYRHMFTNGAVLQFPGNNIIDTPRIFVKDFETVNENFIFQFRAITEVT